MTWFVRYAKGYQKFLAVFLLFCTIFAVVFWQYHLPVEAVLYPMLLCLFVGSVLLVLDFRMRRTRHQRLERMTRPGVLQTEELPSPVWPEDDDYQQIIRSLVQQIISLEADSTRRYQEMAEYYTLWAHQIKTPISSMRLHLQNEDSPLSRQLRADLFRIEQYAEMVLAFLRLDAPSADYVFREQDLDELVRQTVKKFSGEFILRKITLEYEPLNRKLVTDEKWLSFVLEQILSNALKYTKEGSIRIYMEEERLCIADTGIGIAPEDLPRIFEKGYTGYNGRTDKRASGLGLYLCKRICDQLGMEITAESALNKGTVIRLHTGQYHIQE